MKLSFYYAIYRPSTLRLVFRLVYFYIGLVFVFSLVNLFFSWLARSWWDFTNSFVGASVFCVCAIFAVWYAWRDDQKFSVRIIPRLLGCCLLYICLCFYFNHILPLQLAPYAFSFSVLIFTGFIQPNSASYRLEENYKENVINIPQMTPDSFRFQLVAVAIVSMSVLVATPVSQNNTDASFKGITYILLSAFALWWFWFYRKAILRNWYRTVSSILALLVSVLAGRMLLTDAIVEEDFVYAFMLAIVIVILTTALVVMRSRKESEQFYNDLVFSTELEYAVYCPVCHYNMSGSIRLRCPECGTEYVAGRLIEENVYLRSPDLWLN